MNECRTKEGDCDGEANKHCQCNCDNCADHVMECEGCDKCYEVIQGPIHIHVWQRAVDPAFAICVKCPAAGIQRASQMLL